MLHTGRTAFRCGGENCDDHVLLGEHLGARGYRTASVGKWHNGGTSLTRSFRQHDGAAHAGMYDSTPFDFQTNLPGGDPALSAYHRPHPDNRWTPDNPDLAGHWLPASTTGEPAQHTSVRWAERSLAFINDHAERTAADPATDPFFLYLAFHAPHDPRQAPREYLDLYPLDRIELPPNYAARHPFDQGDFNVRDEQLAPWPRTEHAIRLHLQEYYAILTHLDAELGRVLDRLDQLGLTDDTVIGFTADHGLALGQHGLLGKQNLYDHSTRVPLLWAGPGVPVGAQRDALVYQHCTYATACDLLGVAPPASVEFPSLVPAMNDPDAELFADTFCYYRDFQRSLRTRDHKLIVYPHLGRTQLFNVSEDPWEQHDLADDPDYRPLVTALFDRLRARQAELGDDLDLRGFPPAGSPSLPPAGA